MDDLSKEIKKKIKEAQKQFKGQVSGKELAQAIYDIYRSRHGYEGTLEDVLPVKPHGYWTFKKCLESALKYSSVMEWVKAEPSAYNTARTSGWLAKCCAHMDVQEKRETWTKPRCIASAKKFKTRGEWAVSADQSAYQVARKNGWLDECCAHMELKRKDADWWTLERCKESALKFKTRNEWQLGDGPAYNRAREHGWMEECCAHMAGRKPAGYWTLERCIASALMFDTKWKWQQGEHGAYKAARDNGWYEQCCSHMKKFAKPKGYWTLDLCKASAARFKTRTAWLKGDSAAYQAAKKNGWSDECTTHMGEPRRPKGYWTLENCKESALKFSTRVAWKRGNATAYRAATKNKWLDACCQHMKPAPIPASHWTLKNCKASALEYSSRGEWEKGCNAAYTRARQKGWMDKCCSHMKKRGKWTFEACLESAKKYGTRGEWLKAEKGAYERARKEGWLDKCCKHMATRKPKK